MRVSLLTPLCYLLLLLLTCEVCNPAACSILAGAEVALPVLQQQQAQQQQGSDAPKQPAAECSAKYCCSSDGYVCVLDDDVALHPLSLMQLVDELEADQSLFMVTGQHMQASELCANMLCQLLFMCSTSHIEVKH